MAPVRDRQSLATPLLGLWIVLLVLCGSSTVIAQTAGRFEGDLVLKALPDGRNMELVTALIYVDNNGVNWPVPAKTRVDGASIPRVFWSILGAPFTGKFREASVIHDYYCQTKTRHWKAVHRVFLDGMLSRGVDTTQAQLMYIAVYRFGPRWNFDADACFCKGCPKCANPKLKRIDRYMPSYNEMDFADLRRRIQSGELTIDEAEDLADYQLNTELFSKRPR
jgi:hypothetical protein